MIEFDAECAFNTHFTAEVVDREEKTGVPSDKWRAAGRASRAFPSKENGAWWLANGPTMVRDYVSWRTESVDGDWRIWEPFTGQPAIEMGITAPIGRVTVRGFIDRVYVTPSGELVIVDLKSGSRNPDSDLQLGFYACLLEIGCGVRPQWGAYYKARSGQVVRPLVDLDHYSVKLIGGWLDDFIKARDAGIFLPVLGGHCKMCGVSNQCAAYGGPQAVEFDPSHPDYVEKTNE